MSTENDGKVSIPIEVWQPSEEEVVPVAVITKEDRLCRLAARMLVRMDLAPAVRMRLACAILGKVWK